jgi:alpha-mannosidase
MNNLIPFRWRLPQTCLLFHLLAGGAFRALPATEAAGTLLWQIGKPDRDDREFLLAPNRYGEFREDGFFLVGRSDPKKDWPYVHPGPHDSWAGGRSHTFSIVFGLKEAPAQGECRLRLALVDTHRQAPPALTISVNDQGFKQTTPGGAGDESVMGQPAKGKQHQLDVTFPARLLKAGANEIGITTRSGSWMLYDWVGLETPPGLELAEVSGTVVGSVQSAPVLVERDGKQMQTINVVVRHFGGQLQGEAKVEGLPGAAVSIPLNLNAPGQSHELAVPAVEKETPVTVSIEAAGKKLATRSVTLKPVRRWVVYLLPHSHVDIGYTHVQTEVERAQWKYLETAMDTARKSAGNPPGSRFKWNVEVLWAVDSYLKQATPQKQQAFIDAVKAGQVGLEALYGNELTGLCRPEELLRLVGYGQQLAQRCGMPIESAMITDVPGYTWGIVPAFAQSGVKYFSIGPNGGDRIGHTIAAWGDKPFWWIGPNGKDRVLVWMTGTGYYQVFQSPQKLLDYLGQLEAKDYPYDFVQVRHCLGDNGAPDVNFADKVKAWNDQHAYPKLVIATADEMFHDFEKRYGDKIPTARGDFTPYWEDGAASSARETALNRASADRLTQAETVFALFNPKAYPADDFYQAWRNVILYDEHTWGAHNSISQPDHPFVKSQWAIKQAFALEADQQSRKLLDAANASRGSAPETPPGGKINAFDVINTTSAAHAYALVVVPKELSLTGDGLAMSPTNNATLRSQRLSTGELVFRPCWGGYRAQRFYIVQGQPKDTSLEGVTAEGATLTTSKSAVNQGLKLRVDEKTGGIASLVYDGHEYVDTNSLTGLNDYFYLPGHDLKGVQRNGPVKISVKEKGPLVASLLIESDAPGCHKLTREIRLHALRNYIEIINTVDKKAVRAKEGVHFGFGFNVPGGTVRMDVPWGVVRPEEDQIPGACKNWFTVQRWVDISNPQRGVTWLTPDAPLVEIGGLTANLIGSLPDPRVWMDKIGPSQTIYSWAMNNHWHTNYRAEQDGPTVFRYFIVPHGSTRSNEVALRASSIALEQSQPLLVLPARGAPPADPPLQVWASQGSASFQVTAFKPSEDGKAWIVRFFGLSDKTEQAKFSWAKPAPTSVWLSDNSEKPLQPVTGSVEVPPYTIVTMRAELP